MSRAALIAGALTMLSAAMLGVLAGLRHDEAREAWARESRRVDTAPYSAERSDALYAEVLAQRTAAERAGALLALGTWLAAAGWGARPRVVPPGPIVSPTRASTALLVDAIALALLVALCVAVREELGASRVGFGALVGIAGPAAATAALGAGLAAGRTLGAALVGGRLARGERSPGAARALLTLALVPLAVVALPLTWSRRRAPLHARWAGLHVVGRPAREG